MKKLFLCIATLSVVAAACQKVENVFNEEEPAPEVKMITETVSGSQGVTKATISNGVTADFSWTAGDNIAVHVSNGATHKYVFTSDAGASGASAAAASASFTIVYPEGYARDAFAVFPSTIVDASAANYGQSGTGLDVTLPGSYTLAQLYGLTSPCPMIATNTAGSGWTFYQLCSLLRLTVNAIPPSTKRLEIGFNGKKVWGDFSIASTVTPGNSVISTSADASHDVITVTRDGSDVTLNNGKWTDGLVLNIPLPTGAYTNLTVTAYDALTGGNVLMTTMRAFATTASTAKGKRITVTFPGVFSVSSTKRVVFASGNLQATYNASTQTWNWGFAAHQYDYIGHAAGNTTITTSTKEILAPYAMLSGDGTVDLFGRSTADTYFGIATTSDAFYGGDFVDWGSLDIDGNGAGYWTTLSKDEWAYLTGRGTYRSNGGTIQWMEGGNTKAVNNALCTRATVNGVNGMIIFPDKYTGGTPEGVTWVQLAIQTGSYNNTLKGWGSDAVAKVTSAGWAALEAAGCVFLPAAGTRSGSDVYFDYSSQTDWGCYWSSTSGAGFTYVLRFNSDGYDPLQNWTQSYGESVRLVHVIE